MTLLKKKIAKKLQRQQPSPPTLFKPVSFNYIACHDSNSLN